MDEFSFEAPNVKNQPINLNSEIRIVDDDDDDGIENEYDNDYDTTDCDINQSFSKKQHLPWSSKLNFHQAGQLKYEEQLDRLENIHTSEYTKIRTSLLPSLFDSLSTIPHIPIYSIIQKRITSFDEMTLERQILDTRRKLLKAIFRYKIKLLNKIR